MKRKDGILHIFIVSTDVIFREGLRELLDAEEDFKVVGEASQLAKCSELAPQTMPDAFLLDLDPGEVGKWLETAPDQFRDTTVILLVNQPQPRTMVEALDSGIRGIFPKDSPVGVLNKCLRTAAHGGYWIGNEAFPTRRLALNSVGHVVWPDVLPGFRLTRRELEIIASVVSGRTNREISEAHHISEDTVKHHLSNIFDKVGVFNRLELALFVVHHGLIGKAMLMARGESRPREPGQESPAAG